MIISIREGGKIEAKNKNKKTSKVIKDYSDLYVQQRTDRGKATIAKQENKEQRKQEKKQEPL